MGASVLEKKMHYPVMTERQVCRPLEDQPENLATLAF